MPSTETTCTAHNNNGPELYATVRVWDNLLDSGTSYEVSVVRGLLAQEDRDALVGAARYLHSCQAACSAVARGYTIAVRSRRG